MTRFKAITVFCGSALGKDPAFRAAAHALGTELAAREISVVYGGASIGLMTTVADAALATGGKVVGVIPELLGVKEIIHSGLTETIMTATMHERKQVMSDRCDGFIALPGGWGTLDELFEILTWAQLGIHAKPVGVLNVEGYFDKLLDFLHYAAEQGFVPTKHLELLYVETDIHKLLDRMATFESPVLPDWAINPEIR